MTALNDADKKHEALANGAEVYVLKPDLFEQLPQLLQTRSMATPYPPARPLLKTCPERAATTGVPSGAAKSRPACISQLPRIGMQPPTKPTAFQSISSHREQQLTVAIARSWQRTGRDRKDGFQPKRAAIAVEKR